uniref:Uncharacterized protein n=1 Tax=Meloidogyne enterolobii TaxID=390850 RepID=A0A6V7V5U1_MELEN|nr:unnamed protein product [Meloidogyne enterolobii]
MSFIFPICPNLLKSFIVALYFLSLVMIVCEAGGNGINIYGTTRTRLHTHLRTNHQIKL